MTENERRILALIAEQGPLTKNDLAAKGEMGWATVVKYVNRLQEIGVLARAGTAPREARLGKNSYLYDLADGAPTFIGIDIEYRTTRVAVVNLRREILWQSRLPTPAFGDESEIEEFIGTAVFRRVEEWRSAGVSKRTLAGEKPGHIFGSIVGIGIGMPRWILPDGRDVFSLLSDRLSGRYEIPVRVENNIRAYTLYKEPRILERDFIVVSVRNGIGAGVVIDGSLYRGEEGLAGEIGHISVSEGEELCRCGKRGCLETVVNQHTLFESYLDRMQESPVQDAMAVEEMLPRLFDRAARGDSEANGVLWDAAQPLGRALGMLLLVLNIRNVYLVGHFGDHGAVWLTYLSEVIRRNVDPRLGFELHYRRLEDEGYLLGAALLVAREYVDYSVLGSRTSASATARSADDNTAFR